MTRIEVRLSPHKFAALVLEEAFQHPENVPMQSLAKLAQWIKEQGREYFLADEIKPVIKHITI